MTICPRCKSEEANVSKSWDVVPKSGKGKAMRVTLYNCQSCGNKFRKASRLDIPTVTASNPSTSSAVELSKDAPSNVSADVPITSASSVASEPTLRTPDKIISSEEVENTHKVGLFERIKRAFTG